MSKKTLSVVVPCYNEEQTVKEFYNAISVFSEDIFYDFEFIFVDDGSKDSTYEIIRSLSESDPRVRYTSFSRNFGKEAAIFCGLRQATGDAVIVMDADLQHPLSAIPLMIEKFELGYDVVEGIKKSRGKESRVHGLFANIFYSFISKMIGFDMKNSSDYKLLSRPVVDALNGLSEKDVFFRALSFWIGFKSTSIEYEVADRIAGETKWSFKSLFKYAIRNITSFTYTPLYSIGFMGIIVLVIGIVLGIDAIVSYFTNKSSDGYPSLIVLIVLATGAIMSSLGIISVYIAKIFNEVKNRPRYISKDSK